jgi:F0F1-type ATP synthase assembly protein I
MITRYVTGAIIGAIIGLIMGYLGATNLWLGTIIGMGAGIFITLLSSSSVDVEGAADEKGKRGSFG